MAKKKTTKKTAAKGKSGEPKDDRVYVKDYNELKKVEGVNYTKDGPMYYGHKK